MGEAVGDRWDEWQQNLHYADYVILAGDRRRHHLPADRAAAAGRPSPRLIPPDARAGHHCARCRPTCHWVRRWRSARSRDRPSCCPVSSSGHLVLVPSAAGLALPRPRPRAAQVVRGRAARGRRARAADRAAPRGGARTCAPSASTTSSTWRCRSRRRRWPRWRSSARSSGVSREPAAGRDRADRGSRGDGRRRRRSRGTRAATRRRPPTRSRSGSRRPARSCPACRATAPRCPPRACCASGAPDANVISRQIALPVILGAAALKGVRLARRGVPPGVARRDARRRRRRRSPRRSPRCG